jgi:hypothetical protein
LSLCLLSPVLTLCRVDRTAVEYTQGGTMVYGKRERPHLIFDPSSGEPTHLCTGVCLNSNWTLCNDNPYPGYYDYTFTSVQVCLFCFGHEINRDSFDAGCCSQSGQNPNENDALLPKESLHGVQRWAELASSHRGPVVVVSSASRGHGIGH